MRGNEQLTARFFGEELVAGAVPSLMGGYERPANTGTPVLPADRIEWLEFRHDGLLKGQQFDFAPGFTANIGGKVLLN